MKSFLKSSGKINWENANLIHIHEEKTKMHRLQNGFYSVSKYIFPYYSVDCSSSQNCCIRLLFFQIFRNLSTLFHFSRNPEAVGDPNKLESFFFSSKKMHFFSTQILRYSKKKANKQIKMKLLLCNCK